MSTPTLSPSHQLPPDSSDYRYPNEVVITDHDVADGSSTPAEEEDDFFSSWSRPAVKKPTPPVSRTATPPVVGRTPSPFLSAQNGKDRAPSPLAKSASSEAGEGSMPAAKPAARVTSTSTLRSSATGPRKTNILGAKKATSHKLGAKKLGAGDAVIDFEEAEKKAKEEAERKEKLGYDPDAEEEEVVTKTGAKAEGSGAIIEPTPVTSVRAGFGATSAAAKDKKDVERLGMGIARLGFGQVSRPDAKKGAGGFGSVGPIKGKPEGMFPCSLYVLLLLG
mgnify:CR=1 FL=1